MNRRRIDCPENDEARPKTPHPSPLPAEPGRGDKAAIFRPSPLRPLYLVQKPGYSVSSPSRTRDNNLACTSSTRR